jgi:hypothetical protein
MGICVFQDAGKRLGPRFPEGAKMKKFKITLLTLTFLFSSGEIWADGVIQVQPTKKQTSKNKYIKKKASQNKLQMHPTDDPQPQYDNYPNEPYQDPNAGANSYQQSNQYQQPDQYQQSNTQGKPPGYQEGQAIPADKPWYEKIDPSLTNSNINNNNNSNDNSYNNNNNGNYNPPPVSNPNNGSGGYNP